MAGRRAAEGLVVARYHHSAPARGAQATHRNVEAAHLVPDAAGLAAAQRILAMVQGLTENDLVLCLISAADRPC